MRDVSNHPVDTITSRIATRDATRQHMTTTKAADERSLMTLVGRRARRNSTRDYRISVSIVSSGLETRPTIPREPTLQVLPSPQSRSVTSTWESELAPLVVRNDGVPPQTPWFLQRPWSPFLRSPHVQLCIWLSRHVSKQASGPNLSAELLRIIAQRSMIIRSVSKHQPHRKDRGLETSSSSGFAPQRHTVVPGDPSYIPRSM